MKDEFRIIEKEKPEKGSTVILAFPDMGLVGPIAAKQFISEFEMKEIGHIKSDKLPPVITVHKGEPTYPIRIYGKGDKIVITSEIPITPNVINSFSKSIVNWLDKIQIGKAIILGGLPNRNRSEIEKPEVHGIPSNTEMEDLLKKGKLEFFQEGFIAGINGVLLLDLKENNESVIYLMAESHLNYPDPGAAASVLESLNEILNLNVDVEELRKKAEEIRVAARDLMRQTQKAMEKTSKNQEEEIPIMYG